MRRPAVLGGLVLAPVLLAGPPALLAWHIRKSQQDIVHPLLDETAESLTDDFVARLRIDHKGKGAPLKGIPLSASARDLFQRVKPGCTLRIFIPVDLHEYLFFFGDADSQYCDIRGISRGEAEQMDQGFIDALIADGGTRQSGIFPMYWSAYIAGRVLKDDAGEVKAICIINGPRD